MPAFTASARVRTDIDFDALMRHLAVIGFAGLTIWTFAGLIGVVGGFVEISPQQTLKFLLAVMVLVFARRTYWEVREWRWRRAPADERLGFASPLWENPRGEWEHGDLVEESPAADGSGAGEG
jgi:hypothetical protein